MVSGKRFPPWTCPLHDEELEDLGVLLRCAMGHDFPVRQSIPRFVQGPTYADAFGAQWLAHRRTQLDSATGTTISAERLARCLGAELWHRLQGLQVLEVGCGAGRFTELLLERGASVTSVDLSSAVDANAENCPVSTHHRVAQADVRYLPFRAFQFDVVLCLGVVQHTPSPEATIELLYRSVRSGGWLVFDHYIRRWHSRLRASTLLRLYARRLPPGRGLDLAERLVRRLAPVHDLARSEPTRQALRVLLPTASYRSAYPELDERTRRQWEILDTHDALTDRYKHLRTEIEIAATLSDLGAVDIDVSRGGNGIEARCRRGERTNGI